MNVSWIFGSLLVLACLGYGSDAQAQGRRIAEIAATLAAGRTARK